MNTKFDHRAALINLIEKMDDSEVRQLLAFAAGYEAAKKERSSDSSTKMLLNAEVLTKLCAVFNCEVGELLELDFPTKGRLKNVMDESGAETLYEKGKTRNSEGGHTERN